MSNNVTIFKQVITNDNIPFRRIKSINSNKFSKINKNCKLCHKALIKSNEPLLSKVKVYDNEKYNKKNNYKLINCYTHSECIDKYLIKCSYDNCNQFFFKDSKKPLLALNMLKCELCSTTICLYHSINLLYSKKRFDDCSKFLNKTYNICYWCNENFYNYVIYILKKYKYNDNKEICLDVIKIIASYFPKPDDGFMYINSLRNSEKDSEKDW